MVWKNLVSEPNPCEKCKFQDICDIEDRCVVSVAVRIEHIKKAHTIIVIKKED